MISDMHNATTDFFSASENPLQYDLLNSVNLGNSRDKRLAVLRKVQFKSTKDGRPFIRASFEDVNGYILIGRMFEFSDFDAVGKFFTALVGKLVLVDYNVDYYRGSLCLQINSIEQVSDSIANKAVSQFVGKYSLAESKLKACRSLLSSMKMSEELSAFYNTFCNFSFMLTLSDETIAHGLRGYILDILFDIISRSSDVAVESVVAFVYSLIIWFKTQQSADVRADDSVMLFIASMMDKRVDTAKMGMTRLANSLSEFTALFSDRARVISSDSYFLYNLYKLLTETSNIKVLESQLPPNGFCSYNSLTIRRS